MDDIRVYERLDSRNFVAFPGRDACLPNRLMTTSTPPTLLAGATFCN